MRRERAAAALLLKRVTLLPERVSRFEGFPYGLPFVRDLDLTLRKPVTCFVGENGSGKSTLIEAIAEACGLPIWGGSRNEAANRHGPDERAALGSALRFAFSRRPRDRYFFRAEFQANFASLLDERQDDPDFWGDPYTRYGGRSLHAQSHGEAFLAIMLNRMRSGMFIMDEPESALSPQRQLALLARMAELVRAGKSSSSSRPIHRSCSHSPTRTSSASTKRRCVPSDSRRLRTIESRAGSSRIRRATGAIS